MTALNRYEFRNAVRFAAFRKVISRADASSSLMAFEADLNAGYLQFTACDLVSVINEADRLSGLHTMKRGHRSFDILHVATARLLKARNFLTFDVNQRKLAAAAQLTVRP